MAYLGANVTGQFDDSSIMMSQQNTLQQQQAAMKQTPGYRMKVPSSSSMPQTGQQQVILCICDHFVIIRQPRRKDKVFAAFCSRKESIYVTILFICR